MTARQESGTAPLPRIDDRASYARNAVLPAAADVATREVVAPFEPTRFQGNYKVAVWAPGDEVRFVKPFEKAGWGCLPVVIIGLLLGPGAYLLKPDHAMFTVIASIIGLVAALFGGKVVMACLPRHRVISWRDRTIRSGGFFSRSQVPFDRLAALELRCVRTFYDSTTYRSYTTFQCSMLAHLQADDKPVEIVSANNFESGPDEPYDLSLPLATELARALNIERRVTDYD